ncbi:MAG TPA: SAM-dependent methyltransferase [Acidimicrobiales bacterium]|nr:SAM-dependent methyltransferase [Acidimicrobiales bacterium]
MTARDRSGLSAVGWTAVSVAVCRARESARPDRWFNDPLAVHLVGNAEWSLPDVRPGLVAWVSVRTRFLDALTMQAIDDGVRQVVIVAAGLDARAFRLPLPPDATVFEVDRCDIVDVKDRLIDQAGLTPRSQRRTVVADILDPGWIARLAGCGWDPDRPTLWLAEGLLIYLDQAQRAELLTGMAAATDGGRLGATLSAETGPMRHPLWHPAATEEPEVWMSSAGWRARGQTMAEASAAFGRPLPDGAGGTTRWRLVSATVEVTDA